MDVREKLVELFQHDNCPLFMVFGEKVDVLADYLIANGLTTNEWFSASEPPKENGYYMCWVVSSSVGEKKKCEHRKLYWEDNLWLSYAKSFRTEHPLYWMPLPQPPKGE